MGKEKPRYIQLTSVWGGAVTLSPMFTMFSVPNVLNTGSSGDCFYFRDKEITQMKDYIFQTVEAAGLKPHTVDFQTSDSVSSQAEISLIWAKYKRDFLLNNFDTAHTLIDTPMQRTYEEYVSDGETGHYESRVQTIQLSVIQSVEQIQHALDNDISDLHDPKAYNAFRAAAMDTAKIIVDKNVQRIASKPTLWQHVQYSLGWGPNA